jgi:c-di-GMP-related signal transduction protein
LVIAACQRLKEAGYMIALDDFVVNDSREPLTEVADIIKVDWQRTSAEERAVLLKTLWAVALSHVGRKG